MAGLDAGRAYNTFPLMDGQWIPAEYGAVPGWRNAFENTAAVQFHHRCLAATTLAAGTVTWLQGGVLLLRGFTVALPAVDYTVMYRASEALPSCTRIS